MKFSELVEKLSAANQMQLTCHAGNNPNICDVAAIDEAKAETVSYIEGEKFAAQVKTTLASALILPKSQKIQAEATERGLAWIEAPEPRLMFAQAIACFYQPFRLPVGIHPTAVIDPTVEMGQEVAIGAHVVIQAGAKIGDRACIHPNVVIYPNAQIGDRTVLHANCVIHERAQVGADCVIHAGAVIGSEGFGFVPIPTGWYKMEQSGYVVLEDGVEIGCNATIDRPAVGETRIARNTKLDNLVQIGHGCQVGQNGAIAAQAGLAGGVKVGNRVILGGQVGVANQANIGDGVQAGAKAGIHSNVEPGAIILGTPAMPYKVFLKMAALLPHLPEMHKALKDLQKRLSVEKPQ